MTIRVGVLGTSWWADAMYLPALRGCTQAKVVAAAGRNRARRRQFADRWEIPHALGADELLDLDELDAVIIATPNNTHYALARRALARGLHVLCEKPLALSVAEARDLVDLAKSRQVVTMVPFTYRFMPTNRWVKQLIDDGYLGRPFHLNLRYFTGFALDGEYAWRFDRDRAGSGVLGDLGTHWLHLARWFFGDITAIGAVTSTFVDRGPRPDNAPYVPTEDAATMNVRFSSGAMGCLQVSAVCHEGTGFGQVHHLDAHGDAGTLHGFNDWDRTQVVTGLRAGERGPCRELPIPDELWGRARRTRVHDTYRDQFRVEGAMIGDFVAAVAEGRQCQPDFTEGLRVQELLDAAVTSAAGGGGLVDVASTHPEP